MLAAYDSNHCILQKYVIELTIIEDHEPSAYSQMLMVEVQQDLVSALILLLDLVVREITTA